MDRGGIFLEIVLIMCLEEVLLAVMQQNTDSQEAERCQSDDAIMRPPQACSALLTAPRK